MRYEGYGGADRAGRAARFDPLSARRWVEEAGGDCLNWVVRSTRVVAQSEDDEVGSFCAYADGRVRGLFKDRTICELDADRALAAVTTREGERFRVSVRRPIGAEPYVAVLLQYAAWTFASEEEKAAWAVLKVAAEEEERATGAYLDGVDVAAGTLGALGALGDGASPASSSEGGWAPPGGWNVEWAPDGADEAVQEQLRRMEAHLRRTEQLRTDYGALLPRRQAEEEAEREARAVARVQEAAERAPHWAPEDPLAARRGPALLGREVIPAARLVEKWLATPDPLRAYMAELEAHMASCERALAEQEEQKRQRAAEEAMRKARREAEERQGLLDQLRVEEEALAGAEARALDAEMQVHKVQWLNGQMIDAIGEARRGARRPTEWIPTWKAHPVRVPPEDRLGLAPPPPLLEEARG